MRQSAQATPFTTARSSASRSAFARKSVIQAPAITVQLGPSPSKLLRLNASEKSTVPGGGAPPGVPASGVPASGVPASGVPASGVPASGVPASGVPASGVPASGVPASGGGGGGG